MVIEIKRSAISEEIMTIDIVKYEGVRKTYGVGNAPEICMDERLSEVTDMYNAYQMWSLVNMIYGGVTDGASGRVRWPKRWIESLNEL